MMRCFSVEFQDDIPLYDSIHCRRCRNQVSLVRDYIRLWPRGIFHRVFNVVVPDNVKCHRRILGHTVANSTCAQCGAMLGWKIIAVTFQNSLFREGRFLMKLDKLSLWNQKPLLRIDKVQDLGANEENADQVGDPNEKNANQDGDATDRDKDTIDQDGGAADQDLGANGQNADQDGDANELVPSEQKVGTNEKNVDQDEDTDEEDVGAIQYNVRNILMHFICQNAYQGGGGNEEVPNEQDFETLVIPEETELSKLNRQLIKINTLQSKLDTLLIKMKTTNQDGNATDQGLGANDQNANQDGDATDQDGDTTDQNGDGPMN